MREPTSDATAALTEAFAASRELVRAVLRKAEDGFPALTPLEARYGTRVVQGCWPPQKRYWPSSTSSSARPRVRNS